jgi:hypothetical protein
VHQIGLCLSRASTLSSDCFCDDFWHHNLCVGWPQLAALGSWLCRPERIRADPCGSHQPTRLSRSDKLHDRPFREQHGTAAGNASAFISSAITESDAVRPERDPTV